MLKWNILGSVVGYERARNKNLMNRKGRWGLAIVAIVTLTICIASSILITTPQHHQSRSSVRTEMLYQPAQRQTGNAGRSKVISMNWYLFGWNSTGTFIARCPTRSWGKTSGENQPNIALASCAGFFSYSGATVLEVFHENFPKLLGNNAIVFEILQEITVPRNGSACGTHRNKDAA